MQSWILSFAITAATRFGLNDGTTGSRFALGARSTDNETFSLFTRFGATTFVILSVVT